MFLFKANKKGLNLREVKKKWVNETDPEDYDTTYTHWSEEKKRQKQKDSNSYISVINKIYSIKSQDFKVDQEK